MKKLLKHLPALILFTTLVAACGDSTPQFVVRSYPDTSPVDAREKCKTEQGRVFFNFEELNSSDITDYKTGAPIVTYPSNINSSFDPTSSSFDITGADIDEYGCYRVTMICRLPNDPQADGSYTYISLPSCAYQKAAGSLNLIRLCFGPKGTIDTLSSCPPLSGPCPPLVCTNPTIP